MANARPSIWNYAEVAGRWDSNGFSGSVWGSVPPFSVVCEMHEGQTLLRTRLEGYLTFGVQQVAAASNPLPRLWYQQMTVNVGIYAKPTNPLASNPPAVPPTISDGWWVQQEQMVPTIVEHYDNGTGALSQLVTFNFASGVNDSAGRRGPWTADPSGIYLVWNFFSPTSFWTLHDANYIGYGGGAIFVSALVEQDA